MCKRIKLTNGKYYTPREVARVSFEGEIFNGSCKSENINTTWRDRVKGYFSIPILGYSETSAEDTNVLVDFDDPGEIVFVKVESFQRKNQIEVRLLTTAAEGNGTKNERKPVIVQKVSA